MKAFLMYPDRSFDPDQPAPDQGDDLLRDLELDVLLDAMAGGEEFLRRVARSALLAGLTDPEVIRYRQQVLRDCLRQPEVVQEFFDIAVTAIKGERRVFGGFLRYPAATLGRSVEVLELFLPLLRRLRTLALEHAHRFGRPASGPAWARWPTSWTRSTWPSCRSTCGGCGSGAACW